MHWDFKDKVVWVSGGTRGIGAAVTEYFLAAGAQVVASYLNNAAAAEQFKQKHHGDAERLHLVAVDLGDFAQTQQEVQLLQKFGHLDVLVNNAGIWLPTPVTDMQTEIRDRTIHINILGLMNLTQAAVPYLQKSEAPSIVNISSTAGQRGEPLYSAYAASKGAVISYTKSLAVELAPHNIRVNAVAPGWVKTEMTADVMAAQEAQIAAGIPLQRVAEPEDMAGPVLFLASSAAKFITGEILNVNGGSVLCG